MISTNQEIANVQHRVNQLLAELRQLVKQAEEAAARSPWTVPPTDLSAQFAELHRQLQRQFELEEGGHWLDDDLAASPQYKDLAIGLHAEHYLLMQQLEKLEKRVALPGQASADWSEIRASFRVFTARLAGHERREDELVQIVVSDDVGAMD